MSSRAYLVRIAGAIALFFAGMSLTVFPLYGINAGAQNASQTTFNPVADASVLSDQPSTNFGSNVKLRADGSPPVHSYVRFDVQGLSGPVTKARLSFFGASGSSRGYEVHAVPSNTWQESTIKFGTAPPMDAAVAGSSGPFQVGAWSQVDVTSLVSGNGAFTFALTTSSTTNLSLASRETATPPRLTIETSGSTTGGTTTTVGTTTQPTTTTTPPPPPPPPPSVLPIRAAFYYPWFPEGWNQQGLNPFTRFSPALGLYGDSDAVIQRHIEMMSSSGLVAGIASWWGQGSKSDSRLGRLLAVSNAIGGTFKWAVYYEIEGGSNPDATQIRSDLTYIGSRYAQDPAYLTVNGKPVIFVYNANDLSCAIVDKWKSANTGFYIDLKVFGGFRSCTNQPDAWHQYAPAVAEDHQRGYSFAISPGFYKANESAPRLARDPSRWLTNVRNMVASNEPWQLVTTFNEWGEGTSVEPALEWQSGSGAGTYLDALRSVIDGSTPPPPPPPPPPSSGDPVIAAAGDIACDPAHSSFRGGLGTSSSCRQMWVSDLMLSMPNLQAVLPLGDIQYECGEAANYSASYDPSWGRVKSITRAAIGNHEYGRSCGRNDATPTVQYFNLPNARGWYSYDIGAWHLIALNSECNYGAGAMAVGGCGPGSPQETWLREDLATHSNVCTLAYWHEPRFSSGQHGNAQQMATIWNDLVAAGADIVLSGHNHDYERFEPIGNTPQAPADPASTTTGTPNFQEPVLDPNGIREFVVGTGGKNHYGFGTQPPLRGEIVRDASTYGVLKLTLQPASFDWQFVNDPGSGAFTDSGSASCH